MPLLPDWKKVLRKAWSVRLMLLAGGLTGLDAVLPLISPDTPVRWWPLLTFAVVAAAFVARLMVQRSMGQDKDSEDV